MLVSCIMPTHNRRGLIRVALKCYLSQDWPDKELVVVDDGTDTVRELVKQLIPDAVYICLAEKQMIGTKRNLACEATSGEVICHFDDDDWSATGRIRDQVTRLLESGKQMTGYHSITYWNGTKHSAMRPRFRSMPWEAQCAIRSAFGKYTAFLPRATQKTTPGSI